MQERQYAFDWQFIGDTERGRPNLGNMTRVEVYRLFQYTLRDILERDYGTAEADRLLREAGYLAGMEFAGRFIGPCGDFKMCIRDRGGLRTRHLRGFRALSAHRGHPAVAEDGQGA